MSFKRSWSRRLAAILSAVMIVSTASPVSVPAMEVQGDDILSTAVTQEDIAEADNIGSDLGEAVTDEEASLAEADDISLVTDDSIALTGGDDELLYTDDEFTSEFTEGTQTDELSEDAELIDGVDTLIEEPEAAGDGKYSGELRLNTVSAGLVKKIAYKFDDDATWTEVDVTKDGVKVPIKFTDREKITFKLVEAANSFDTIQLNSEGADDGYFVKLWVDGHYDEKKEVWKIYDINDTKEFKLKEYGFRDNETLNVNINAQINKKNNKKGNLVIHVASENRIPGTNKVISINNVNVKFGEYAIKYDVSGNIVSGDYRNSASVNYIGAAGYGGTITLPYWCAKYATIWIDDTNAESGNDENGTRYAYTVGNDFFYSKAASVSDKNEYKFDLVSGIGVDTHITVGVKQISFDPEIKFSTISNRIMTGFKVTADDGWGHTSEKDINALSDDEVKTQIFAKARKLLVSYNGFTLRDGASEEFKRDSGNDKNWVYRIEYMGTDGKTVSKSLSKPSQEPIEIDVDSNGRFPEEIKVSAIPNVKVTLSANGTKQYNRDKSNVFSTVVWQDEDGNSDTGLTSTGEYSFWVEPGRSVWINKLFGSKDYIFPYVEEATPVYEGEDSVLRFALPKIMEDRLFSVSFHEFSLEDKGLITVINGVRNDDGLPGKASVSINGFYGGYAVYKDADPGSQLYGKNVFGASAFTYDSENLKKQLEIDIKMDSTQSHEYSFDRISYDCYECKYNPESDIELCAKKISLTDGSLAFAPETSYEYKFDVSKDAQGNNIAKVYIPTRWVLFKLIKDGKLDLTVSEHETRRKSSVALSEDTPGTIKTASVKLEGEYKYAINRDGYSPSGLLPYGSDIFLKAEPAEGFKLVSVDIICPSNSDNNETVTDSKKLEAFAGDEGYKYNLREGITVKFYTEPVYCATVRYKTGIDELKSKEGKYSIDHKRPVLIQYRKGNSAPEGYNCDIYIGAEKITSNEGITKSGDIYTVDASKGDLAGKNVTFKFYTGDGSKTDTSLRTLTLVIDKADTGVKFGADKYTVPLGTQKEFSVSITGSFEAKAVLASDKSYDKTGLDFSLDTSKKKFVFKSTAASKPDTYTINIVNPYDPAIVYGSVRIELETSTVKSAQAPSVQIVGTTNSGITVGLRADKIDAKIDGLAFKVKVTTSGQTKGYFETTKIVYVPITETSKTIDMMTEANKKDRANKLDGDTGAKFAVEVWIAQVKTSDIPGAKEGDQVAISTASAKADPVSPKEGKIFETKLRLKKISKGTIYNTMSVDNAYRFGVIYSKKTQVQWLDHVELLTGSGEEVVYPEGRSISDYLEIEDDHTIAFHPGGKESLKLSEYEFADKLKCLAQGTYIIKAYALEPGSLEVSASVKVKVERGVNGFDTDGISGVIYKQAGKAVSLQLTAVGRYEDHVGLSGVEFVELATKKARYEIVNEKNTNGLVKISKGGKITINKKLEPDNTEFTVRIIADEFVRNPGTEEIIAEKTIKVGSSYDLGELSLAYYRIVGPEYIDEEFSLEQGKINRLENSYFLNDLTPFEGLGGEEYKNYAHRWEYAPFFWITVYDRNKGDGNSNYVPVDFKISGAARLLEIKKTGNSGEDGNHGTCARIEITDLDKDIKITAYAKDGSGRKIKNYKVRVKSASGKLGVLISDEQCSQKLDEHNVLFWDYGNTDLTFDSFAMENEGMNMLVGTSFYDEKELKNKLSGVKYKITSVKGGRIAKVNFYYSKIYPTAPQTTFIITDLTSKKDYKVNINNKGYVDRSKKTRVTMTNKLYDASKGKKTVDGVIYSHLDFSSIANYTDYDSVKWNTVKFHVDSAEDNQYVMVRVVSSVKRVGGTYKVVTKSIGDCFDLNMKDQSMREETQGGLKIERSGAAYPVKLTGKEFAIDFYNRNTKKFDMLPGSYKLVITPVRREGYFKYRTLASPATVTLKVVTPPKANVNPGTSIEFGTSEGTVTKGKYSNFLTSPVYKEQGIFYKELKDVNIDGKMNGFRKNFNITDNKTGKIKYVGTDPIGMKDKDRNVKLQGWLILEYQQVDGTVVEKPVKVKIVSKGEIRK